MGKSRLMRKPSKAVGAILAIVFLSSIWAVSPLFGIGFSASMRTGYQIREFSTEYWARLRPNRVYWHDFRRYRMDCPAGSQLVTVLHTSEFDEAPRDFLARNNPGCGNFVTVEDGLPLGVSGALIGCF